MWFYFYATKMFTPVGAQMRNHNKYLHKDRFYIRMLFFLIEMECNTVYGQSKFYMKYLYLIAMCINLVSIYQNTYNICMYKAM